MGKSHALPREHVIHLNLKVYAEPSESKNKSHQNQVKKSIHGLLSFHEFKNCKITTRYKKY